MYESAIKFYSDSYCFACLAFFFFFNDTATTEIYTLSLHDALPIFQTCRRRLSSPLVRKDCPAETRSEEHTSELQSLAYLVCRLLLEKKKIQKHGHGTTKRYKGCVRSVPRRQMH